MAGISSFGSGGTNAHVIISEYVDKSTPISNEVTASKASLSNVNTAFIFAGQGLLYAEMGRGLFESEVSFREVVMSCSSAVDISPSLVEVMFPAKICSDTIKELFNDPVYEQLMLFALEVGLSQLWKVRGIRPQVVCGHSIGEYAAAVSAGILKLKHAAKLVYWRAKCIVSCKAGVNDETMVAVRASEAVARKAIASMKTMHGRIVVLAAVNGPHSIVLSGHRDAIVQVMEEIGQDVSHKYLPMKIAYHSPLLDDAAIEFRKLVENYCEQIEDIFEPPEELNIALISCITGKEIAAESVRSIEYWVTQLKSKYFYFVYRCIKYIFKSWSRLCDIFELFT
jgi:acyl transferase domain-containing protein